MPHRTDPAGTARPEPIPERALLCPVCGSALRVEARDGIAVDVCDEHGIWLDRGELQSIVTRLHSRLGRRHRRQVESARKGGTLSGALFGWWAVLFD
jgi:Zn-finger nucleic acid-binding protein